MAHPGVAGPGPGAAQRPWGRRLVSPRGAGEAGGGYARCVSGRPSGRLEREALRVWRAVSSSGLLNTRKTRSYE